ncbi:hypothetical protein [Zwartia sp.]|uniref:hypothetical protein n=1 Tax=Zwartia sp. TaxID=2978004 RepID=UPI00271D8D13|nr:hypothetical protein [Zwartia sp.]MDO9024637.1 hypothetical protein [Zwartia sp.]
MKSIYYTLGNKGKSDVGLGTEQLKRGVAMEFRKYLRKYRDLTFQEKFILIGGI